MAEFAVSTNLISWAPARADPPIFGWPTEWPESEYVKRMRPGDFIVPKFAQRAEYRRGGGQKQYQQAVCARMDLDYEEQLAEYDAVVAGGQGAVPFVMRVVATLPDLDGFPSDSPWACVGVEPIWLNHPLSTQEFLRLRVIPVELARQFKATAAAGRHIQDLFDGTADAILRYGKTEDREQAFRRLSLVRAADAAEGVGVLRAAGRGPQHGDRAFLVTWEAIAGMYEATHRGQLAPAGEPIAFAPDELASLFLEADKRRDRRFPATNALAAVDEITTFLDFGESVHVIDDFGVFHDRYATLPTKVNQAHRVLASPPPDDEPTETTPDDEDDEQAVEQDELEALLGLDVAAVQAKLPNIELPDSVLREAVTALRSGKHLLLSGPPGTGKSTVAAALCRAVRDEQFDVATATADWTTFDTIGGYLPTADGPLRFQPGIVLRCLQRGWWLVIDELNRADIDKAFGPLFTLLAGTGSDRPNEGVVLPFTGEDGKNIELTWAESRANGAGPYVLTPSWRLIGTLNVSDKATLFQLSFAFLRRFAVVDVPLPPEPAYRALFDSRCEDVPESARSQIVDAAMSLAFGQRELGPAILLDIANFVATGLTTTVSGQPYEDPVEAFLTGVRLYAVPQYEGATAAEVADARARLKGIWPDPPEDAWRVLSDALDGVALS